MRSFKRYQKIWARLYTEFDLTQQQIANLYNSSPTTVGKWLKDFGVKTSHTKTPEEKFWERVDVNGEDKCWEWEAGATSNGYGHIWTESGDKLAHRISMKLHGYEVPSDKEVCHKCDNPSCVNPNHLYIGTHRDNMEDAVQRQRFDSKLTPCEVSEIRRKYKETDLTQYDLADEYNVSRPHIGDIIDQKYWKSVN